MATISKVIRLSQKLRSAEASMSTVCMGFVGRRYQKKYCLIQQAIASVILETIKKNSGHFQSITSYLGNYETENRHSGVYIYHSWAIQIR